MTIEKGKEWGSPSVVPPHLVHASGDAQVVANAHLDVQPTGGNLWRSLGSPAPRTPGDDCTVLPIDVMICTVSHPDGLSTVQAVADVVVGSWFSRAGFSVITNVGVWNGANIAPRAHPNDGEFDVFTLVPPVSLRQKVTARRRARTGTHVPHPSMTVRRARSLTIERSRWQRLVIDGREFGRWSKVSVEIRADFMNVIV